MYTERSYARFLVHAFRLPSRVYAPSAAKMFDWYLRCMSVTRSARRYSWLYRVGLLSSHAARERLLYSRFPCSLICDNDFLFLTRLGGCGVTFRYAATRPGRASLAPPQCCRQAATLLGNVAVRETLPLSGGVPVGFRRLSVSAIVKGHVVAYPVVGSVEPPGIAVLVVLATLVEFVFQPLVLVPQLVPRLRASACASSNSAFRFKGFDNVAAREGVEPSFPSCGGGCAVSPTRSCGGGYLPPPSISLIICFVPDTKLVRPADDERPCRCFAVYA